MDAIQEYLEKAERAMAKAYARVQDEFAKIRAGRAVPSMLDGLLVAYYGSTTPINQVASVSALDARTLVIKPWEKRLIPEVEKAIANSNLRLTPQNDGEVVRLNIPPITEERRKELVKQAKSGAEQGRVAIRNARKELRDSLKRLQREGTSEDAIKVAEAQAQKLTDAYIGKLDTLLVRKEAEVMKV